MPELPILEAYRGDIEKRLLKTAAVKVALAHPERLRDTSSQALETALIGRSITDCCRYGKYILLKISATSTLALHLGLRGGIRIHRPKADRKVGTLDITFDNGLQLAVTALFGEILLVHDQANLIQTHKLGPDALGISQTEFITAIKPSTGKAANVPIKGILMDQHHLAGLGNIYTDEILYQAQVNPKTALSDISPAELKHLYKIMTQVLETAIAGHGQWKNLPDDFLTVHRKTDNQCPKGHGQLTEEEVAGRHSYFCATCQKLS